jgi:DNA polymerase-3 subunit gamma/tau
MGQALYRTHRPKKLSEIVGQEHITTAIDRALKKGTISHAYLFTGPRGVGKTSIARILAHEINGLPYNEDQQHLDIIEIDAASNRRIDEIRDLRDKVHIAPSSAKYKVYIIDEVHMLTKEAFNALLKTLEEPPAHVVFILATTEVHKLPETIISRTQRYAFKPVEQAKVVAHLRDMAKKEKVTISDEALELIAAHGEGSFRDSISLLDQIRNTTDKVELTDVQAVLGIAPDESIAAIVDALNAHDSVAVATYTKNMNDQGYEASQIAKQVSASLRRSVVSGASVLGHDIAIKLLGQLVQVPASPNPTIALEIALLDAALSGTPSPAPKPQPTKKADTPAKVMTEDVQAKPAIQIDPKKDVVPTPQPLADAIEPALEQPSKPEVPITESADSDMVLTDEAWELILNAIKTKYNTLYSIAKTAETHFAPGKITLEFSYAFHQKRLSEAANKQKISEVITGVTGSDVHIECIVGTGKPKREPLPSAEGETVYAVDAAAAQPVTTQPVAAAATTASPVDAITNIFGSAELLES